MWNSDDAEISVWVALEGVGHEIQRPRFQILLDAKQLDAEAVALAIILWHECGLWSHQLHRGFDQVGT